MVIFLAGLSQLQPRGLHKRIRNRLNSDDRFTSTTLRVATTREPGPYRVVAETDRRIFTDEEAASRQEARLEIGFKLATTDPYAHYWLNWIEPDRSLLLGWHRDSDHDDLGPVHIQVNQNDSAVAHEPATLIDRHPMAVVEARLEQLPDALATISWNGDSVTGFE